MSLLIGPRETTTSSEFALPEEVLLNIFDFLVEKELALVSKVCRLWYRVSHDKSLASVFNLYVWGTDTCGELGLGPQSQPITIPIPTQITSVPQTKLVQVVVGGRHSVLLADGKLWSWGTSYSGQLGHGDNLELSVPTLIKALIDVKIVRISAGNAHTAAISDKGELYVWGLGDSGKLGHGNFRDCSFPKKVEGLDSLKFTDVALGVDHSMAVANERLYTWGKASSFQLGHQDPINRLVPTLVETLKDISIVAIACCNLHSACVSANGLLWTWGCGDNGRLGHGDSMPYQIPKAIESLRDYAIVSVACGWSHTVALDDMGRVFTFGGGWLGVLGHGSENMYPSPLMVKKLRHIKMTQIAAGWNMTLGISEDGVLYTCGRGASGQLGHGDTTNKNQPKKVKGFHFGKFVCVSAGYKHAAALLRIPRYRN
eukprot:TRINITY_DN6268_c0_g1_i1.p1 TRINITY_DN6268_c0_g1~~TRINITY_DN6268_c0_g1_i1.p1  ORF type:complete len:428 (-),score=47.27 TRINITY_DN6268_c0_g1_i1:55-1338(-)